MQGRLRVLQLALGLVQPPAQVLHVVILAPQLALHQHTSGDFCTETKGQRSKCHIAAFTIIQCSQRTFHIQWNHKTGCLKHVVIALHAYYWARHAHDEKAAWTSLDADLMQTEDVMRSQTLQLQAEIIELQQSMDTMLPCNKHFSTLPYVCHT